MAQLSFIFNELLVHSNTEIGLSALACIESWAGNQFKYQVFADEIMTRNLLLLISSRDEKLFVRVAQIMLEAIRNSANAEILKVANASASMGLMRSEEVGGIKSLIDSLASRAMDFINSKGN